MLSTSNASLNRRRKIIQLCRGDVDTATQTTLVATYLNPNDMVYPVEAFPAATLKTYAPIRMGTAAGSMGAGVPASAESSYYAAEIYYDDETNLADYADYISTHSPIIRANQLGGLPTTDPDYNKYMRCHATIVKGNVAGDEDSPYHEDMSAFHTYCDKITFQVNVFPATPSSYFNIDSQASIDTYSEFMINRAQYLRNTLGFAGNIYCQMQFGITPKTPTGISSDGSYVTVTFGSNHGLVAGDYVKLIDVSPGSIDETQFTVYDAPTGTTLRFASAAAGTSLGADPKCAYVDQSDLPNSSGNYLSASDLLTEWYKIREYYDGVGLFWFPEIWSVVDSDPFAKIEEFYERM